MKERSFNTLILIEIILKVYHDDRHLSDLMSKITKHVKKSSKNEMWLSSDITKIQIPYLNILEGIVLNGADA